MREVGEDREVELLFGAIVRTQVIFDEREMRRNECEENINEAGIACHNEWENLGEGLGDGSVRADPGGFQMSEKSREEFDEGWSDCNRH